MSLLADSAVLDARAAIAARPLGPLATSLRDDLRPLLENGFDVPHEKALLSRDGGRCERDGMLLRFDPYSPREHTCPRCGTAYRRDRDYLWWIMSYQIWLAERAVYAAALHGVTREASLAELAERILEAYVTRYLEYPNRDNALGPTRPFFSTYLESIWLLQLTVALSLLEATGRARSLGERLRDRVIEPSARLIASFDEGDSNRQVWNAAALVAAGLLLGNDALVDRYLGGPSGVAAHLAYGLLPDGSWYEGENYHVFAHRGLWYGVTLAEHAGCPLPAELVRRFEEGFALPLITALPDLTIPSRRDSQYAISLRQWRFAESFELGLARRDDARLVGALRRLYGDAIPRRDTGRWRSAADVQPHEEGSSLTRADLGWRGLLFARATLPDSPAVSFGSSVLEGQGLAIFRRDGGRVYVALDYGHSGGGHGHPDRLNILFARDVDRILDDYGTGSYVDPSLHWYRSTLAHNAPLFDGASQLRASGRLIAHDERAAAGWADAEVPMHGLAPDVYARRTVIVMTDYLVDHLEWNSPRVVRTELPIHVPADITSLEFQRAPLAGGVAPDDGFSFVHDAERAQTGTDMVVQLRHRHLRDVTGWVGVSAGAEWWRAVGPGPPGSDERSFALVRVSAAAGSITSVWSWSPAVTGLAMTGGALVVHRGDRERHEHARRPNGWSVTLHSGNARSSIDLGGLRRTADAPEDTPRRRPVPRTAPFRVRVGQTPLRFELGEQAYRQSEDSWEEAGKPTAVVTVGATDRQFFVEVSVQKPDVVLRPPNAPDPALDNEHPDIHSDGVQLYLLGPGWQHFAGWLAVPESPAPRVRTHVIDGARADVPITAEWRPESRGYGMRFAIPLSTLGAQRESPIAIDLVVNEMARDRTRRRGQLVLSGGGGWIYLQGDRQSPARFLPLTIERG